MTLYADAAVDPAPSDLLTSSTRNLRRNLFPLPKRISSSSVLSSAASSSTPFIAAVLNNEANHIMQRQEQVTMQSRDGRVVNRTNSAHGSSSWVSGSPAVVPKAESHANDGTLNAIVNESVRTVDVPIRNPTPSFQEDELLSWLQYPLDDAYDRGYCSDWFGDVSNSSSQIVKHSFNQLGLKLQETSFTLSGPAFGGVLPPNSSSEEAAESCGSAAGQARNKVAGADAAMAVSGGQAAGLTSHPVMEVLGEVQATTNQPSHSLANSSQSVSPNANLKGLDIGSLTSQNLSEGSSSRHPNPLLPYVTVSLPTFKPLDSTTPFVPLPVPGKSGSKNFLHFSRPAAETKANLHVIGAESGPTNVERVRQQFGQLGRSEQNAAEQVLEEPAGIQSTQVQQYDTPQNDGVHARWPTPPPNSLGPLEADTGRGKGICRDSVINSSMSNSAVTASEKVVELETAEQTATSPSRGSGSSTEKSCKEAATSSKRKFSGRDDLEYQSEDVEEIATNHRKPPSAAKRTRAAEMHNQSERRRRDKIKEKMKALQELIPNSNKTDKASILDEAIEYTKLLQSQLQTMSMRSGIGIPPTMLPTMGMHHLQMPALPHMGLGMGMGMGVGLGMGMGMGMGMGLLDAAGRTVVPIAPFPGQSPVGASSHAVTLHPCGPSMSMAETQELQNSNFMDPYSFYLPHHQVQHPSLNMSMQRNLEIYNAYMQQQQQLQQQQPQRQQQKQQQQQPQQQQAQQVQLQKPQSQQLQGSSGSQSAP